MKPLFLKIVYLLFCFLFFYVGKTNAQRPSYAGVVEYTQGNFGTFNYSQVNDSVKVYLKDTTHISFEIYSTKGKILLRNLEIDFDSVKLVRSRMYKHIITPDKIVPTGNYDLKFSNYTSSYKPYTVYDIYLTHFADGSSAYLYVIGESEGLRVNDICIINLVKLK